MAKISLVGKHKMWKLWLGACPLKSSQEWKEEEISPTSVMAYLWRTVERVTLDSGWMTFLLEATLVLLERKYFYDMYSWWMGHHWIRILTLGQAHITSLKMQCTLIFWNSWVWNTALAGEVLSLYIFVISQNNCIATDCSLCAQTES